MRDSKYRAASAEAAVIDIAKEAKEALSKIASRSALLDAAMRVIMKRGLLDDFSHELNNPPPPREEKLQADHDALFAERLRLRSALFEALPFVPEDAEPVRTNIKAAIGPLYPQ